MSTESKLQPTTDTAEADAAVAASANGSSSKKGKSPAVPGADPDDPPGGRPATAKEVEDIMRKLGKMDIMQHLNQSNSNDQKSRKNPKDMEKYKFWQTQPVTRVDERVDSNGPIEGDKAIEDIRQTPYPLPKDFQWSLIDIEDDKEAKELYELLSLNYVEDDDAMFRFDYSAAFLKWALQPPGWKKPWHIGVRVTSNNKLVAFISGIPAGLRVRSHQQQLVEINFLCVHKKLRAKRLAPVLIKEVTRRVNLEGIFQAAYTAGVYLPTPVATCRYYHRSLNPKKLVETGFSYVPRNMTIARMIRLYKLPETTFTPGLRPMSPEDVPQVTALLNDYMKKFPMAPFFSESEVRHWLLPVPTVVFSYVAPDAKTGKITDFFSFYSLPSRVIGNALHTHINAAYLFYYAPSGLGEDKEHTQKLLKDALILARREKFDVFNCLDLLQNQGFLDELKFGRGDGNLHYYLYNYRCQQLKPEEVGLVLL
ncbi:acyl-CoA N-acyltransferase [Geranomyces variabilis]|nr:acyl-CoA N-acyltransferase [Geranomyces variabilis]KAJ3137479.1 Glycylpeptide N-tetradecanoyltransferase 2 [Geranomyces variabilis]